MTRTEKRRIMREVNSLNKTYEKFSDKQLKVIEVLALQRANEYTRAVAKTIDEAYKEAMRGNRVSKERADRIIKKANELVEQRADKLMNEVS